MSANVIQHTKARRKRAGSLSWTARHLLLLAIVIAGIIAASWLAPELAAPPAPAAAPQSNTSPAVTPPHDSAVTIDAAADLAAPPPARARARQSVRRAGVPLDAAVAPSDDYEILSAAELDGISQARD